MGRLAQCAIVKMQADGCCVVPIDLPVLREDTGTMQHLAPYG